MAERRPAKRGLLITGTDTGCGKTTVTTALVRLLRQRECPVSVCKPVASGAQWEQGRWMSEDTRRLAQAVNTTPEQVTFWTFPEPAAPPVAARLAGIELNLERIVAAVRQHLQANAWTLVEGVGGLLCPLTATESVADLALALELPVLVVTRRSLGTLNHTLLTLEAARLRKIAVVGVIVAETTPVHTIAEETCLEELSKRMQVPLLGLLPYRTNAEEAELQMLQEDWFTTLGGGASGGASGAA